MTGSQGPRSCCATRTGYGDCVRVHMHPGWHSNKYAEEWPQYTQDRDLRRHPQRPQLPHTRH